VTIFSPSPSNAHLKLFYFWAESFLTYSMSAFLHLTIPNKENSFSLSLSKKMIPTKMTGILNKNYILSREKDLSYSP
jgi:hypothetical protein